MKPESVFWQNKSANLSEEHKASSRWLSKQPAQTGYRPNRLPENIFFIFIIPLSHTKLKKGYLKTI